MGTTFDPSHGGSQLLGRAAGPATTRRSPGDRPHPPRGVGRPTAGPDPECVVGSLRRTGVGKEPETDGVLEGMLCISGSQVPHMGAPGPMRLPNDSHPPGPTVHFPQLELTRLRRRTDIKPGKADVGWRRGQLKGGLLMT